jgi:hypothetical protein
LEKPRRTFSFDKVEVASTHVVGRKDDSFVSRPTKPRNATPQRGDQRLPTKPTGYQ